MNTSTSDLQQLEQQLQNETVDGKTRPPVHLWKPDYCGELDITITRDGRWFHEGGEIRRQSMVDMFASILWREKDSYFLVTPVEKVGITVEDVPFQITELSVDSNNGQQRLTFITAHGDKVIASAAHPLRVELDEYSGEPSPYIMVRYGMEGRLNRNVYYQLAELAQEREGQFQVESDGEWFVIG